MKYGVELTEVCLSLLEKIPDKRIQSTIMDRIEALRAVPDKQGKALVKKLAVFVSYMLQGGIVLSSRSMKIVLLYG